MKLRRREHLPSQEQVVADLAVLARLRSLSRLRTADFHALYRLPALSDHKELGAVSTLSEAIERAIRKIPDENHQAAAFAIFSVRPERWTLLRERQSEAAAAWHVGYDAYRRRRSDGVSLYEETLVELATALTLMTETWRNGGLPAHVIEAGPRLPPVDEPAAPERYGGKSYEYRQLLMRADNPEELSYWIRERRMALGIPRKVLAWDADLSMQTISNLENGAVRRPHSHTLERLADAFAALAEGRPSSHRRYLW